MKLLVVLLLTIAVPSVLCCTGGPLQCFEMKNIVQKHISLVAAQNAMICISFHATGFCPRYDESGDVGLWAIPTASWLGKTGCPTTLAGFYNVTQAVSCANVILNAQGLTFWGAAATACQDTSQYNCTVPPPSSASTTSHATSHATSHSTTSKSGPTKSGPSNSGPSKSGPSKSNTNAKSSTTDSTKATTSSLAASTALASSTEHAASTGFSATHSVSTVSGPTDTTSVNTNTGDSGNSGNSGTGGGTGGSGAYVVAYDNPQKMRSKKKERVVVSDGSPPSPFC